MCVCVWVGGGEAIASNPCAVRRASASKKTQQEVIRFRLPCVCGNLLATGGWGWQDLAFVLDGSGDGVGKPLCCDGVRAGGPRGC